MISNSNTLESFVVQEAKLGKYAMVHKDATVSGTWNFPKDSYIKAAYAPDSEIIKAVGFNCILWRFQGNYEISIFFSASK